MGVLALIPARGGSKSIPKKNLATLAGIPLIVHSIRTALACPSIDRVLVSTDCDQIRSVAVKAGAETPFLRPLEFAQDESPDLPVFRHTLEWLAQNENWRPEMVVHLRPTTPLRDVRAVEEAIRILRENPRADSVRSVCEPTQNPFKMWKLDPDGTIGPLVPTNIHEPYNQPRQSLPRALWHNGYVDVIRSLTILQKNSMTGDTIFPMVMDSEANIDIDDLQALRFAEAEYFRKQTEYQK